MASESDITLRQLLPCLHLLRASGLAIDPRKMLLGGLGLVLLVTGDWLFSYLPFAADGVTIQITLADEPDAITRGLSHAGFLPRRVPDSWLSWDAAAFSLLTPVRSIVEPGRVIFQTNDSWSALALAWTRLLWALIVWSFVGGAICRMSALQFAKKRRLGIGEALRFSQRQLLGYLLAPLLPVGGILFLLAFTWLLGFLAWLIPVVGPAVLGLGWFLVLFCGFLMAMMLTGIVTGWPFMIAAISAEDSDGFDGLSRAFGYLFDRPWHAALFAFLALPVFSVSRLLVGLLVGLTISLGVAGVEKGSGSISNQVEAWTVHTSQSNVGPGGVVAARLERALTGQGHFAWPDSMSEFAIVAWTCIPALLLAGLGPSFFWSAATVIYFLLRESDDGTSLDAVVDRTPKTPPDTPEESVADPESAASSAASSDDSA